MWAATTKRHRNRCQSLPLLTWERAGCWCHWETHEWMSISALIIPRACMGCHPCTPSYQGDNGQHALRKKAASIQTKSNSLILDKMVERKDLSSPPLTKTPKSQLTGEQPLTKKTGTYQKKIFYIQQQRRSHSEMVGGVLLWCNQLPYQPGAQPTNWKIITLQKFSHRSESSESHIRLPSLRVWLREEECPEYLAFKASRAWEQELHRTGGNRDSTLGGHKVSHTLGPSTKQWFHRSLG